MKSGGGFATIHTALDAKQCANIRTLYHGWGFNNRKRHMTYYFPCRNCATDKTACKRRLEVKSALSGLNVTSIKFKCEDRKPMFGAGQRVSFAWKVYQDDCEGVQYGEVYETEFVGTVISEANRGLRFIIRVDAVNEYYDFIPSEVFKNDNLIIKVKPVDMVALDEPNRSFCLGCFAYDLADAKGRCQGHDGVGWDRYIPDGCLRFTK